MYVDDELSIKAYYAGHVLGAAMFEVRVGQQSIVYTVKFIFLNFRLPSLWMNLKSGFQRVLLNGGNVKNPNFDPITEVSVFCMF